MGGNIISGPVGNQEWLQKWKWGGWRKPMKRPEQTNERPCKQGNVSFNSQFHRTKATSHALNYITKERSTLNHLIFKRRIFCLPGVHNEGTIEWWFCFQLQKDFPSPRFLLSTQNYFYYEKRLSHNTSWYHDFFWLLEQLILVEVHVV